jgi:methionyl aminopeptidase
LSITIKSTRELEIMRAAGQIVANTLQTLRSAVEAGMTTKDLDRITEREIRRYGAIPSFPSVYDFPGSVCASVNDEVVHGIPGKRRLKEGDIVKLDVGAIFDGYHGDAAVTVAVGRIADDARRLMETTEQCLALGIAAARHAAHLFDIGAAIQEHAERRGFSVVRQYVGHGIGRALHEDPNVPHYRQSSRGVQLREGMTFTIEPMINAGTHETLTKPDRWTVVTKDGKLSAQFEHTVAITTNGPEILTLPDAGEPWGVSFAGTNQVQYQ